MSDIPLARTSQGLLQPIFGTAVARAEVSVMRYSSVAQRSAATT